MGACCMKLIEWCNRVGVSLYWLGGTDWMIATRDGESAISGNSVEAIQAFDVAVARS